jgi:hypothetical protein
LSFLSRFPHQAKNEIEALFAAKHLMAVGSWQSAWKMIASFCIELQDVTIRHEVPELFSLLIKQIGPGAGELEQMMQALQYSNNPKFASVIGDRPRDGLCSCHNC